MASVHSNVTLRACLLILLGFSAVAQHEGHEGWDEASGSASPMPASNYASMKPYIHFTVGDTLWFEDWVPKTTGAMAGACIGLFLLGILERWIAAVRAVANLWWRARTTDILDTMHSSHLGHPRAGRLATESKHSSPAVPYRTFRARFSAPPMSMNELCRGILYAAQSALTFAFMLVVMTYQGAFLISLVLGLGFGEMLFGRYTNAHVGLTM
ncbi:copper transporter [Coprinopsis sp. MPI-PUGE-AT-0042]|nr:copper transporter [Coprinopsis sp. MPI-PUGE-AT-0042]KAH6887324.1 copper transporter [Coprinopsis sp. MPI-PUGE-AT-0042]